MFVARVILHRSRRIPLIFLIAAAVSMAASSVWADPLGTIYVFPAGGQRGPTVKFRSGGLCLHGEAAFEMLGAGVKASD